MIKRIALVAGMVALLASCSDSDERASDGLTNSERTLVSKLDRIEPTTGQEIAAWCNACHGFDGLGTSDDIPHLASQTAFYLFLKLTDYKGGDRENTTMENVATALTDDAMMKVAAYYADQMPAEPEEDAQIAMDISGPVEEGRVAAAACSGCHGATGNSTTPGTPGLAGHHPADLVAAMEAYKEGNRDHPLMESVMYSYDLEDINNIALFYAVQEPQRTASLGSGDPVAGERVAEACTACHGKDGNPTDPNTPQLAGEDAEYLITATKSYIDGRRDYAMMTHPVAVLSDQDIVDLSTYYARQTPKKPIVRRPLSTKEWAARCDRCHGDSGMSTDVRFPSLAAQHEKYIRSALRAYRDESRNNSMMKAMSMPLSEGEIASIADHYASNSPNKKTIADN
jgi:cytochrome c553